MKRIVLAAAAALATAAFPQVQRGDAGASRALGSAAPPSVAEIVNEVDRENLIASIGALESFGTRYASTAAGEAAGTAIGGWFRVFGLPTDFEYFQFGTVPQVTTSNVIAALPGNVDASRIVIVSAHYDSRSPEPLTLAPGADDNASGTAVVVELARIMAKYEFDFTVKFIAWGAEERGLLGSRHHAQRARQRGDRIIASVVADMVGYTDAAPENLDIVSDERSQWLAGRYAAAAAAYSGLDSAIHVRAQFGSDCMAFWEQGYPSACAIEDDPPRNPHYHKVTDTLATLNPEFLTAAARATLALVAQLAQPASTPGPPTGLQVVSQITRSRFQRVQSTQLTWEGSDDVVSGYHVYRATSPHGMYRRLTTSIVTDTYYVDRFVDLNAPVYYVVTAVDGTGRESNFSAEASVEGPR